MALKTLHQMPVPTAMASLPDKMTRHLEDAVLPQALALDLLQRLTELCQLPSTSHCLIHNDIQAHNLLWGRSLKLIDWEYACLGPHWLDLARACLSLGLNAEETQSFLQTYGERDDQSLAFDLALKWVSDLDGAWTNHVDF